MKAINDAIKTKVDALTAGQHNSFYTAIGGRFYYEYAPSTVTFPYAVYHSIDEIHNWVFDTKRQYNITIQVDLLSELTGATEIETLRSTLLSLFEYKSVSLTVTGYTFIYMKFIGGNGPERVEDIWNYNARFEIEVEAAS